MNVDFYLAFEERYRGSRDLIKSRLQVYLPFVEKLQNLHHDILVIDLGCGRGEWLELLRERNISALGIDLDDQMLSACRERDLRVETADALVWLAERQNESCDVVSAFHLAEHLPFDHLDQLVSHGLRVLRPGGLLILETPNPENIIVGTTNFYLDPTHLRPLPPPLLNFLLEYHGFGRTKILRLQESDDLAAGGEPTLIDVLGGASPDYAVVAQKQGEPDRMASFDALFAQDYGVATDTLALRYQQAHQQSLRSALELARQAVEKSEALLVQQQQQTQAMQQQLLASRQQTWNIQQQLQASQQQTQILEQQLQASQQQAQVLEQQLQTSQQQAQAMQQQLQTSQQQTQVLEQRLQALYASRSWRLTAPMRAASRLTSWFARGSIAWLTFAPMSRPHRVFCQSIIRLKSYISGHPRLKTLALRVLAPFPHLKERLKTVGSQSLPPLPSSAPGGPAPGEPAPGGPELLPPRARQVYTYLKAEIKQRRKEQG